jgi:hypothetical protein
MNMLTVLTVSQFLYIVLFCVNCCLQLKLKTFLLESEMVSPWARVRSMTSLIVSSMLADPLYCTFDFCVVANSGCALDNGQQ